MNSVVIVAGGRGTRMGGVDKLFLPLAGRPVLLHTWRRFDRSTAVDEIVLVTRTDQAEKCLELAGSSNLTKPFRLIAGGAERQDSVWNGLEAVSAACEVVAIQDAARPCTAAEVIADVLFAAAETGAAVAATLVADTIKETVDGETISRHPDRGQLRAVQTPQAFRIDVIRRALRAVRDAGRIVTDDTAACELIGQPVRLVVSDRPNPKVTTPADIPLIEALLRDTAG